MTLDLRAATEAKIAADDLIRDLTEETRKLRGEVADARKETVHSVQCVADWISQQHYGTRIYSAAPALPAEPQEPVMRPTRVQARRVCEEMEREFFEKLNSGNE